MKGEIKNWLNIFFLKTWNPKLKLELYLTFFEKQKLKF